MRSASALFFAALGGAAFSLGAADAAAAGGGFFGSSGVAARPRGFLPGWGLPRHESVFDRVSRVWVTAGKLQQRRMLVLDVFRVLPAVVGALLS